MSTYITKEKALEFDNAPDWLVAFLQSLKILQNCTDATLRTYFVDLRGFFQWASYRQKYSRNPKNEDSLHAIDIGDYRIEDAVSIKRADVENYLYFLDSVLHNSTNTRNKKLASIKTFYNYILVRQNDIGVTLEGNPAALIKQAKPSKKNPIYVTEEDSLKILRATIGDENELRDRAILLLLDTVGLRRRELVNLDVRDLDLESKTLRIEGKGDKERKAYLTDVVVTALREYLFVYRATILELETPALFVSRRFKKRLTGEAVSNLEKKYVLKAGLGGKGYTLHKHRHGVATALVKEGKNLMAIKEIMGHDNIATTQKYMHLDETDIRNTILTSGLSKRGASFFQEEEDNGKNETV